MILVLSDLHLGYKDCNSKALLNFLDEYRDKKIKHLVLLGDIFDFWRRNNAEVVQESEEVMVKLNDLNAENIHYVAGNHDYNVINLNKRYQDHPCLDALNKGHEDHPDMVSNPGIVSKYLRLKDGGESFFFIHGYELEAILWEFPAGLKMYEKICNEMCYNQNTIGGFLSKLWGLKGYLGGKHDVIRYLDKEPSQRETINQVDESGERIHKVDEFSRSAGKYPLLGMEPHENLIFGHTHWPFINKKKKVANTGSWIKDEQEKEVPKKFQNSYIEINDGQMELKFWPPPKTKKRK